MEMTSSGLRGEGGSSAGEAQCQGLVPSTQQDSPPENRPHRHASQEHSFLLGFSMTHTLQRLRNPFPGYLGKEVNFHESPKKKVYLKTGDRVRRRKEMSPEALYVSQINCQNLQKKKSIALDLTILPLKNQTSENMHKGTERHRQMCPAKHYL